MAKITPLKDRQDYSKDVPHDINYYKARVADSKKQLKALKAKRKAAKIKDEELDKEIIDLEIQQEKDEMFVAALERQSAKMHADGERNRIMAAKKGVLARQGR